MTTFPKFKLLEFSDKELIETFTKKYPPYSDFNFISLWSYDTHNDVTFSWLNDNLVIRLRNYLTKQLFYSFLGNLKTTETINKLFIHSKQEGLGQKLFLIPEENIKELLNDSLADFVIEEDVDQNDYIIPLKDTISLSNINPHKQETYKKFLAAYPNYLIRELDITDLKIQDEILKLFHLWASLGKKTAEDTKNELDALLKLLSCSSLPALFSLGLYINNQLIGFIIDERVQKPYVVGHFIKANLAFPGVYEVLNKVSAEMHDSEGYELINIEQDLGIKGLRVSKMQRSPVFFLKKYTITPK